MQRYGKWISSQWREVSSTPSCGSWIRNTSTWAVPTWTGGPSHRYFLKYWYKIPSSLVHLFFIENIVWTVEQGNWLNSMLSHFYVIYFFKQLICLIIYQCIDRWLIDFTIDWSPQVKEVGVSMEDCSCLAQDASRIFGVYWNIGAQKNGSLPPFWPARYSALSSSKHPLNLKLNGVPARVYLSVSWILFFFLLRSKWQLVSLHSALLLNRALFPT